MNLSKRGKWLTGIAALIAAYVAFGPKDSDSVEPARHTAAAPAHAPRAATTLSAPVARSLLALAHRVVDPTAAVRCSQRTPGTWRRRRRAGA